jgi:frataxin-like iron-binding protein CyaY
MENPPGWLEVRVAPDSHYVIGRLAPANQIWILIGQGE